MSSEARDFTPAVLPAVIGVPVFRNDDRVPEIQP